MSPIDFLPHLISMNRGYKYARDNSPGHTWYRSRTDDILAVETDKELKLICVGTEPKWREWRQNVVFKSVEWLNMGRVHKGFAKNVHELMGRGDQVDSLLTKCIYASISGNKIVIEGHSRGFPIALLVATMLIDHRIDGRLIKVVGCAGARVGNKSFQKNYSMIMGARTFCVNSKLDPVPYLPPWGCSNGIISFVKTKRPIHPLGQYIDALYAL